jgi:hypothetical protein
MAIFPPLSALVTIIFSFLLRSRKDNRNTNMEKIIEIQNTQKRKIAESFYIAKYPNLHQKIGE